MGDSLIPSEVTAIMGAQPSKTQAKGDQIVGKETGTVRIAKSGMWMFHSVDCEPADLDKQVQEILSCLTQDLSEWASLKRRFAVDLFCGFFMEHSNEGITLSPHTLASLGQRGIELALDIYGPSEFDTDKKEASQVIPPNDRYAPQT